MVERKKVKEKNRIEWIDICKYLGILAIYIGHFGTDAGDAFKFVFTYHVPLFFFLSGCMDTYDKENSYWKYVWKKFKTIMIPYYGFAFFIVILQTLALCPLKHTILEWIKIVLLGCIRDDFFAGNLWFLTCLFVIQILFKLFKYCTPKILTVIFSFMCVIIYCKYLPDGSFKLPYNIDAALWYIGFYALGFISFPKINQLLNFEKKSSKVLFTCIFVISAISAAIIYLVFNPVKYIEGLPSSTIWFEIGRQIVKIVVPLILIALNICVSRVLVGFSALSKMGRETLYLCLNEFIIKNMFIYVICLTGLGVHTNNTVMVIIYSIFLLYIGCYLVIPFEKYVIGKIKNNILTIYSN